MPKQMPEALANLILRAIALGMAVASIVVIIVFPILGIGMPVEVLLPLLGIGLLALCLSSFISPPRQTG
jgi:hypothetical protein